MRFWLTGIVFILTSNAENLCLTDWCLACFNHTGPAGLQALGIQTAKTHKPLSHT